MTRDPLGGFSKLPATQNPYPYALGNPVNLTDPSGEISVLQFLIALRPIFDCAITAYSCIGDYLDAITIYNEFVQSVLDSVDWRNLVGGTVLVLAGGALIGAGIYCLSVAGPEAEALSLLLAAHSYGICGAVASFGAITLACGIALATVGECIQPSEADAQGLSGPNQGLGKE